MSEATELLQQVISNYITEIRRLFKCDIQVTVVCRDPANPDGGCMVGNDEPEDVIAEIKRRANPNGRNEVLPPHAGRMR